MDAAATHLRAYLAEGAPFEEQSVEPAVVETLRSLLPTATPDVHLAVDLGRAWAQGRRSLRPINGSWAPVVSGRRLDPHAFPRLTGETLIGMIGTARSEIMVATAYLDGAGVEALIPSLVAAARRGVAIEFAAVERLARDDALLLLEEALTDYPAKVLRLSTDSGFPHLKVLVVDSRTAYIGSANFTLPGMSTNLELGALVEGEQVEAIASFVRLLLDEPSQGE